MSFKYKTKPVEIEAFRLSPEGHTQAIPQWFFKATADGTLHAKANPDRDIHFCNTRQGPVQVNSGDYLIRLEDGEIYPCSEEVFNKKYEKIE
ncbi:hypothetical protein Tiera_024 [Polaromonas phage Tiera]|nr:hypothetical protein Tiera_024 [Polaromonas phage Tiera]